MSAPHLAVAALLALLAPAWGLEGIPDLTHLALAVPAPDAPPLHNPLELFNVAGASVALERGVRLWTNATAPDAIVHGQWVRVSWSGVPFPSYDDFIALYPDGAAAAATAPLKFKLAARADGGYVPAGAGTADFRLINVRRPLRFALVRGGLQYPRVAAWSEPLAFARPNQPTQIHLSLTATPGELAVQWTTRDRGAASVVQWGSEPGVYVHHSDPQTADSVTYTRAEMCGPPANASGWFDPGWMHRAVMTRLDPGKKVYYRVGTLFEDGSEEWSEESEAAAPPPSGTAAGSVKVVAVADLGQAEVDGSMEVSLAWASLGTATALAAEVQTGGAQLLLHNGDVSYARGFSTQWDVYWDVLDSTVRSVPYMTTLGNHERDWPGTGDRYGTSVDSGGECGVAYARRTRMPTSDSTTEDSPWYSFDFGPIHFLQYSTEHAFDPGSPQHAFIAADLAGIDRKRTPWVVVGGHRPMYIDSVGFAHDQTTAAALRDALEDLFLAHRVDATWHGHHHSYQRTCRVAGGSCVEGTDAPGMVHLVIGHAGAGLSPNIHLVTPPEFARVVLRHGYLKVEANETHMVHQVVASDAAGGVMDAFVLVKGEDGGVTVLEQLV